MTVASARARRRSRRLRQSLAAVPFVLPSLALFGLFVFYPLVRSVWLGFHATDPFGRHSLLVTGQFALYTVIGSTGLGLYLALLVHRRLPGIIVFRTVFTSTVASSVAVSSVMWLLLLNPGVGVLNYLLGQGGVPAANWLTDPKWALPAIAMTTVWMNVGLATIVILAGLQNIPEELYESARVDGARPWSQFIHVTLPALSPTLLFVSTVGVIFAFQSFGQIDILTKGGPLDSTTVIVYSIYREAFLHYNVGLASAQAVVLFVIILLVTLVQFVAAQRWVFYR
jgi:ABC-type sugar transport system permease subunit